MAIGRIDYRLYRKLDGIRDERNDVIHRLWIYLHRQNRAVIRKKLEKLALVADELVGVCNKLVDEVGVDEILEF